ncbi:DUF7500 family protein [Natrarchaeobaculum aegyptiacum]|uniref:Flagella cluster protein n=1 Tax=Natrarchaeobaculum aegyptiacum TaxID=745377 RepID=A0A2Z2HQK8_9EURY|nr:hypothetical protein [Natrarchaeobaculum aegyptiacum]ARS88963.1 hypothetical protein B1756_03800 [Natrarchaeobaculum aegyptiacum]
MTERHSGGSPKDKADVPPVLPSEQPGGSDGGGVLSPEDLDISNSPYVAEVSEGRYVVSADRSPPNVPDRTAANPRTEQSGATTQGTVDATPGSQPSNQHQPQQGAPDRQPAQSPGAARSVLAAELERTDARYAVDIVSRLEGADVRHRTTSDDVVGTFDNLVLWYAQHVATETPTQRTASLLFDRSEFSAPPSPDDIKRTAKRHGLTRSSTIGDLLEALE